MSPVFYLYSYGKSELSIYTVPGAFKRVKIVEVIPLKQFHDHVCSLNKNNLFRLFFVHCIFIGLLERKRAIQCD